MTPNVLLESHRNELQAPGGRRLRAGFVGAGGIAPDHATALRLMGDVELAAVCDLQASRAKALAAEFGFAAVHGSVESMLDSHQLDVVHVLTPPQHHTAPALQCLEAGCLTMIDNSQSKQLLGWKSNDRLDVFVREAIDSHVEPLLPGDYRLASEPAASRSL